MTPEELVGLALAAARAGLAAGELPIGAVVVAGDEVVATAYTEDRTQDRRVVHAELLAVTRADRALGRRRRPAPLRLGTTLEPCLMCVGAAMALVVEGIWYALPAPGDGAAGVGAGWRPERPDRPFSYVPPIVGGIRAAESRALFATYVATAPPSGYRDWAASLTGTSEQSPQ